MRSHNEERDRKRLKTCPVSSETYCGWGGRPYIERCNNTSKAFSGTYGIFVQIRSGPL